MNEGDVTSDKPGTCARDNGGKVMFSLVPMHLLAGTARVLMHGAATKYAPWNWAKGGRWSQSFDCACRHLFKWWFCREDFDKDSGLHHLDHVMCNILFLRHNTLSYTLGDDRPPKSALMEDHIDFVNELFSPDDRPGDAVPICTSCSKKYGVNGLCKLLTNSNSVCLECSEFSEIKEAGEKQSPSMIANRFCTWCGQEGGKHLSWCAMKSPSEGVQPAGVPEPGNPPNNSGGGS